MWLVFAAGSALFAGATSILAKLGVKNVNSNLVTALRTIVVVVFSWLMVFVVGSQRELLDIDGRSLLFLSLSGLSTGASWICYYRALSLGDVNKVAPVDKSSTVLTMLLAFLLLGERVTALKFAGLALIAAGSLLMAVQSPREIGSKNDKKLSWLPWALGSAFFASLTSILGKVGIENVESNLGTALRTLVVLAMAWVIVLATGKQREIKNIEGKSWLFITLSGVATGASWLCFWRALQLGDASAVVPVDKLSILVTVAFSWLVLKERLTLKAGVGLALLTAGTLMQVF